jgi:tRNA pseudouridine55 synthase
MNGVLLLDKPPGISSNRALQATKRLFGAAKAGHTGTLDPFATGLLPICFGEATKFSAFALEGSKAYLATMALGVTTSTGDIEGEILRRVPVHVGAAQVDAILGKFRGAIDQVPPMYSALKVDGRPLYDYARHGTEVPRTARRVAIYALERLALKGDALEIRVECSKGTYIRTLAEDIGNALGCGAHLTALRRTRCAGLDLRDARTLDEIQQLDDRGRAACLLPVDTLVSDLARHTLCDDDARSLFQGRQVPAHAALQGTIGLYRASGPFIGIGEVLDSGAIKAKRLVAQSE